jgi:transcription elongation GreA/GreB family factor
MEPDTVICMARGPQNGGTIPSRAALPNTWTADMPTSKECRQHAEECLRLANETTQIYARQALLELAAEFRVIAEQLETRSSPPREPKRRGARPTAAPPTRRRRAC